MNRFTPMLTVGFLLGLTGCTRMGPVRPYQVLDNTLAGVRTAFDADAGKVRVVMLVSPTCGVCLNGASEVSERLSKLGHGKDVRVYVVWVPRLGAREGNVPSASRVVTASWAQQYWDRNDLLGAQYQHVLGWSDHAWDVYMLYGPKTQWTGDLPPAPEFYMHQTSEKGPAWSPLYLAPELDSFLSGRNGVRLELVIYCGTCTPT